MCICQKKGPKITLFDTVSVRILRKKWIERLQNISDGLNLIGSDSWELGLKQNDERCIGWLEMRS